MFIRRCLPRMLAGIVLLIPVACARSGGSADTLPEAKVGAPALPASALPVNAVATSGALDGKTFVGKLVEQGKESTAEDQLIFTDGTFRSVGCDEYGFGAAPYQATVAGDATTFDAVSTSVKEGKMTWHGVVRAEVLSGTTLWEKQGQASIEYSFVATIKK